MQKRTQLSQRMLIACCAGALLTTNGCRSAMPKWNLFSFGRKPSPELLAGEGPATRYPAPPSASATPQAIASTAGGTASRSGSIAQTAGASAENQVNTAAAQANGFGIASNGSSGLPEYAQAGSSPANATIPAIPTGYRFGSSDAQPGSTTTNAIASLPGIPGAAGGAPSAASLPGSTSLPPVGLTSMGSPNTSSQNTQTPNTLGLATSGLTGGLNAPASSAAPATSGLSLPAPGATASPSSFQLPTGLANASTMPTSGAPTNSKPFTPKSENVQPSLTDAGSSSPTTVTLPTISADAGVPNYQTANAALTAELPGSSPASASQPSPSSGGSGSGFAPGSTFNAGGYPGAEGDSSSGGTFFR